MSPTDFIARIAPFAVNTMRAAGVPASVTIAQAALESGWGEKAPGNNLFGIKADAGWHGETTSFVTHEVIKGERVQITAKFRAYPTWQGSVSDHAAFLTGNPRYQRAFAHKDAPGFVQAIAAAGYATDPCYAAKLMAIITAHKLRQFDGCGP